MAEPEATPSTNNADDNSTRTIIVAGATGKQGRAFIESAIQTTKDIHIVALTRNSYTQSAQDLKSLSSDRVRLAQTDLNDADSVRKVFEGVSTDGGKIWGVFIVLAFPGLGADGASEEKQGITLVDLAAEFKVSHLIYSSAERGGEEADDESTLSRLAKVRIERRVKSLEGVRWTLLRPTFFMENFDGTIGSLTTTVLRCGLAQDTKTQLIAANDIGRVALSVFQASENYSSKIIVVRGDLLTPNEMNDAYKEVTGKNMPSVPNVIGKTLVAMNKHTKWLIEDIERVHKIYQSYSKSPPENVILDCRAVYPDMLTFEQWVKNRGVKKERKKGWNSVSIWELARGKR